jgi:2-keto-3-deoxy-L-rhamnonate aldolase RhmA
MLALWIAWCCYCDCVVFSGLASNQKSRHIVSSSHGPPRGVRGVGGGGAEGAGGGAKGRVKGREG